MFGKCVSLTLMQSICQVNRGLAGGSRRSYCLILIFVFVTIFISTQIQFSTHGRDTARRRRLLRLPQLHHFFSVYFFPSIARVLVVFHSATFFSSRWRKNKIFSGTFSQYFHSLLIQQEFLRFTLTFFASRFVRENILRRFSTNYIKEKLLTEIISFTVSQRELVDLQLARNDDHLQLK